jgi:hypothetical protein
VDDRLTTNRRGFFGRAWREALTAAPKLAPRPLAGVSGLTDSPAAPPEDPALPPFSSPIAAAPVAATEGLTLEDLLAHASEVGLAHRRDAIRSLARWSVRLTPAAGGRSRLGTAPDVLAEIDLSSVVAPELPTYGRLRFDADAVHHVDDAATVGADGESLEATRELLLPRVWSDGVEALALNNEERDGWQALRVWLAERQGVELHDQASGFLALHRLLGYPDETSGDMPLTCELLADGAVLDEPYPRMHPRAPEVASRTGRWRLLLQLSTGGLQRVYFWVAAEDLRAGDFSQVQVIRTA